MSEYVHIVSLDAPSPPDYGGAIDINYKIVALAAVGKKVILHYFDYKESRGVEGLDKICFRIYSYKRHTGFRGLSLALPYIVRSRINADLIRRINEDNYPVILEGIHCSGILPYIRVNNRKIVLRLHNNETKYYRALAKAAPGLFKQLYYVSEGHLLDKYQRTLPKDLCIAGLSESDLQDFRALQYTNLHFVPSFIPWQEVRSKPGLGEYCLYQGNMTVSENEEAALWLIENIFSVNSIPFIIAGKAPTNRLIKSVAAYSHIQLIANPTEEQMQELVQNAQLNILPSFNNTGVKLKLLNALLNGRHCLTNPAGIEGSQISGVILASSNKEMAEQVNHFFKKPFSHEETEQRQALLEVYNNRTNAQKLSALIS